MYYLCIDLDTSAAMTSSDCDPPMEELNLEPPEPPIAEDDEGEQEDPTAEEIVQVGVAPGQLDDITIPVDQRDRQS